MNSVDSPFDIVRMTQIMPLVMLLHVVQDDHGRDKINDFSSWQQMQITSTISTSVTVHPVEFQFVLGRCADFVKVVRFHQRCWNVKDDKSAPQVHADGTFLLIILHVSGTVNSWISIFFSIVHANENIFSK